MVLPGREEDEHLELELEQGNLPGGEGVGQPEEGVCLIVLPNVFSATIGIVVLLAPCSVQEHQEGGTGVLSPYLGAGSGAGGYGRRSRIKRKKEQEQGQEQKSGLLI